MDHKEVITDPNKFFCYHPDSSLPTTPDSHWKEFNDHFRPDGDQSLFKLCSYCLCPLSIGDGPFCRNCSTAPNIYEPFRAALYTANQDSFDRSASPALSRQASNSSLQSAASGASASSKRGQKIPGGYMCFECFECFDRPGDLKYHQRKHQAKEDRPHGCDLCDQRFLYPKDLRRHQSAVHPESYPQDDLGKSSAKRKRGNSPPELLEQSCQRCSFLAIKCMRQDFGRCVHCKTVDKDCKPTPGRRWSKLRSPVTITHEPSPALRLPQVVSNKTAQENSGSESDSISRNVLRRNAIAAAKEQAQWLKPSEIGHRGAVEIARHWLTAIESLITFEHHVKGGRAKDTAVAIEHLMADLDLVEARHDLQAIAKG